MAASPTTRSSSRPSSPLGEPIRRLHGIGADPKRLALLERLGIRTIEDLVWHLPRSHRDLSKVGPLSALREGGTQAALAMAGAISERRTRGGLPMTEMQLKEADGRPSPVRATWFGRQFVKQRVQEGQLIRLAGKVRWFGRGLVLENPDFEPADSEGIHTGRIVPVYRVTEGLSEKLLRRWMHTAVEGARDRQGKLVKSPLVGFVPEPLPEQVRSRHELPAVAEALRQVHFPDDPVALFRARRRLAFDELLTLQLATAQRRARWAAEANATPLRADDGALEGWIRELPFTLTAAQRRVLGRIRADLAERVPMSRLLEGDVGSGKTVVAALAMRVAHASGAQSAFMAPAELLAEQHFATLQTLFSPGGPVIAKLTSGVTGTERARILEGLERGALDAVVGTHALLEEGVRFRSLALAIVDEQHRFGVAQRSALRAKGAYPHVLLTTATPIPQTLWQTLNRDLDVSVLDELPAGRREIRTEVRTPDALPKVWPWVATRVAAGEQAFVVCPRIDPADDAGGDGAALFVETGWDPSAVAIHEELRSGPLKDLRVALVHGRMPQKDRDAVMSRFRDRELDVLVATTVVEVGIDIPGATVMVVLGAERFGLAQLHQLRGRVGRGALRSYCVLVSPDRDSDRLSAMTERIADPRGLRGSEEAERSRGSEGAEPPHRPLNGFELAERDLRIRGPGQFLGKEQSGQTEHLRIVDLMDIDPRLLEDASAEADRIVAADPDLERPEHRGLREAVDELWRRYGYA